MVIKENTFDVINLSKMKNRILPFCLFVAISFMSCNNQKKSNTEEQKQNVSPQKTEPKMNNFVSLFEIPATDISRAINFYQAILGINIEKMEMQGLEMGVFPYENQAVHGVIMKDGNLKPSANGVTIYLNGGDNLQIILDKVEKNGGKIVVPKTAHADDSGFFALFLDTEGNKLGLNSPN